MSQQVLMNEYKGLLKEKWVNIELVEENIYKWNVALIVLNEDSIYYGGYFKAQMTFPKEYPYKPPDFCFTKPVWHPNIYPDGRLCISILHTPGEDVMSGESAGERWSPAQRVESVLISILSLLDDAEVSSPANVDASVMYRDKKDEFKSRVAQDVEASKLDIPEGFVMPTKYVEQPVVKESYDDEDFWADSDAEGDFGDFDNFDDDAANGSESDEALNNDSEDEEGSGDNDDDDDDLPKNSEQDEEEDDVVKQLRKNRSTPFAADRIDSDMVEPEH